jgi:tRNA (guanine-N7-)-methyltransferase
MSGERKLDVRQGAFFGRRKGHRLRPRQASLFDTLLPRLALPLQGATPGTLSELFPGRADTVRVEIGFGGGEHLIAQAQQNPEIGFIGIEPFVNGMAKALAAIDTHGLANVRLHFGDAVDLLQWLPSASVAGVDLLYPDPWPKRRHWKRRFVQQAHLEQIASVLRPGGEFRFATDMADYAAWTLLQVLRQPDFLWTAEKADDWRQPWPGFVRTRYEAKALREGRVPTYLRFERIR